MSADAEPMEPMDIGEGGDKAGTAEETNEEPMELTEEGAGETDTVKKARVAEREGSDSVDVNAGEREGSDSVDVNAGERGRATEAEVEDEETSTEREEGSDVVREDGATGGSVRSKVVTGDSQQETFQREHMDPGKGRDVVREDGATVESVSSEVVAEQTEPYQKEIEDPAINDEEEEGEEKGDEKVEQEISTKSGARGGRRGHGERQGFPTSWISRGHAPSPGLRLPSRSTWSSSDTARYRDRYRGKKDNPNLRENYEFYTNQIPFRPHGDYIDRFHERKRGNYRELEWNHSYIQWLFPIRERGMNWEAQELQLHEVKDILADDEARERLMTSYQMMLDFYGMKMKGETGELERTSNYKDRFRNLNTSSHNYLRITRILKCLGEFNMEHLKASFIEFVLHEAIVTGELCNALNSCMNYWVEVLREDRERNRMWEQAREMVDRVNEQSQAKRSNGKRSRGGNGNVQSKHRDDNQYATCAQPGAQHGTQPGAQHGAQPEGQHGTQPGAQHGTQPGAQHGAQPEGQHGTQPGDQHGTQPGDQHGTQPGAQHGAQPENQHGTQPGDQHGTQPGAQHGAQPENQHGKQPGDQHGTQPGADSAAVDPTNEQSSRGDTETGEESKGCMSRFFSLLSNKAGGSSDGDSDKKGGGSDGDSGDAGDMYSDKEKGGGDGATN